MMHARHPFRRAAGVAGVALAFALAGCGGDGSDAGESQDPSEDVVDQDAELDDSDADDSGAEDDSGAGEGADSGGDGVGTASVDGQTYTLNDVTECELTEDDIQVTAHNEDQSVLVDVAVFSDVPSLNGVTIDVPELDYLNQPKEWTTFGFGEGTDFDYTVDGSTFSTTVEVGRAHGADDTEPVDSVATIEITC